MEKCFLVVIKINNIYYIKLSKTNTGYALDAFKTKKDALKQFDSFKQKALNNNYETHISGSMGILNLTPYIIEVELHNPESLRPYLIEDKATILKGSVFGAFVNMVGAEVKKEILNLSVMDVAKEYIKEVYS